MQLVRAQSHKDTGPVGRQGVWAPPALFGETRPDVVTRKLNSKDLNPAVQKQPFLLCWLPGSVCSRGHFGHSPKFRCPWNRLDAIPRQEEKWIPTIL